MPILLVYFGCVLTFLPHGVPEVMTTMPRRPSLLIIEDDMALLTLLIETFTDNAMEVEGYGRGLAGFERLSVRHFDLVILDIGLPDINGFDLFKKMRALSAVPVLFLTARTRASDCVTCLEMGAVDFVPKPFDDRVLLARVRKALRETGREAASQEIEPSRVRIEGGFRVDPDQHTIHFQGQLLPLTRIEFAILACLIQRPYRVFSRAQLLEMAWPEKVGSMERTIDSHIRAIRAKLRVIAPDQVLIKTHQGLGYALNP